MNLRRRSLLVATPGLLLTRCAHAPRGREAVRFQASRRLVETRFGRIAVVERGQGEAALFLHGFPLNSFQWRGALERLSPFRRCVAPDFMGLGFTEVAAGQGLEPFDQAQMLIGLLDALSIDRVDLVANDSGGAVAQLLMCHFPHRVRTALLTNCDVEPDCPPAALGPVIELARQGRYVAEWLAPWLADPGAARSAEGLGGMTYSTPVSPSDEALEVYLSPLVRTARGRAMAEAYALALERNALLGTAAMLSRSTVPTRIVWGAADSIFSFDNATWLDHTLGASRGVRRLEGAKLFFPEEYPEVIAEEARRLWEVA